MKKRKPFRIRESYTWGDIAELMEVIAVKNEQDATYQRKLAAMHRSLARDLRALVAGKLALGSGS